MKASLGHISATICAETMRRPGESPQWQTCQLGLLKPTNGPYSAFAIGRCVSARNGQRVPTCPIWKTTYRLVLNCNEPALLPSVNANVEWQPSDQLCYGVLSCDVAAHRIAEAGIRDNLYVASGQCLCRK